MATHAGRSPAASLPEEGICALILPVCPPTRGPRGTEDQGEVRQLLSRQVKDGTVRAEITHRTLFADKAAPLAPRGLGHRIQDPERRQEKHHPKRQSRGGKPGRVLRSQAHSAEETGQGWRQLLEVRAARQPQRCQVES